MRLLPSWRSRSSGQEADVPASLASRPCLPAYSCLAVLGWDRLWRRASDGHWHAAAVAGEDEGGGGGESGAGVGGGEGAHGEGGEGAAAEARRVGVAEQAARHRQEHIAG